MPETHTDIDELSMDELNGVSGGDKKSPVTLSGSSFGRDAQSLMAATILTSLRAYLVPQTNNSGRIL
jgi:hypothetical protein